MTDDMEGGPARETPVVPDTKAHTQHPDTNVSEADTQSVSVDGYSGLQVNTAAAMAFLKRFRSAGPWVLAAIGNERTGLDGATFRTGQEDQLAGWIAKHNGVKNLYFHVNPLMRDMNGPGAKAKKTDVRAMDHLHVDVDPRAANVNVLGFNKELHLTEERARIKKRLDEYDPSPTFIIDSGGGYQAFWTLDQEYTVNGDEAVADELERYNRKLMADLDGDASCVNLDRIMRLPGTINIPDKKKRDRGRIRALASVVKAQWDRVHPLSAFAAVPPRSGSKSAAALSIKVPIGILPRVLLDDLPADVDQRIKAIIVQGRDVDAPKPGDNSRSAWLFDVVCNLVRWRVPDDVIFAIITDPDFGISASVLDNGSKAREYAVRQIEKAKAEVEKGDGHAVTANNGGYDEDKPTPTKLAQTWLDGRQSRVIRYDGEWLAYDSGAYLPREDEGMRSEVWRAYPKANSAIVSNIMDAAKGLIHLDKNKAAPPCWLDGRQHPEPDKLLVLRNGVLDLDSGVLLPHTDQFFTRNALDFDFDPIAPPPKRFLQFLNEVWPEQSEKDCHAALQQMFGYLLTPDTSQQKIFVMVGPPRSGKSTIGRLLERILGEPSVCSLTFSSMGTPFGRQSMIGKRLALVSDMRIGKLTDRAAVAETLLTISGEDTVCVPRKHMTDWSGHLPVRFLILSNEPPTLDDPSGALLSRYILLETHQSFRGSEDRTLDDQLAAELPGILNWAIDGWKALRQVGHFIQPANAQDMARSISRIASPLAAFVEDECEIDPTATVKKDELYRAFKDWLQVQNRDWHGNKETFSKSLMVSCSSARPSKARDQGDRVPVYRGLKLKTVRPAKLDLGPAPF